MNRFKIVRLATITEDNQVSFEINPNTIDIYFFGVYAVGSTGFWWHHLITKDGLEVISLETIEWVNEDSGLSGSYLEPGDKLEVDASDIAELQQAISKYTDSINRPPKT